jgi:hypothetical protein
MALSSWIIEDGIGAYFILLPPMEIKIIQECFQLEHVFYSKHALFEMEAEEFGKISDHEVDEAIRAGQIIESYPNDKPYPSMLIYGRTEKNRPIHIVCAYNIEESMTIVITVYHPDPQKWTDFSIRRKV